MASVSETKGRGEDPAVPAAIWLLPVAFLIHDAEELATRGAWLASNGEALHALLQRRLGIEPGAVTSPMSLSATATAMGVLLLVFVAVTAGLRLSRRRFFFHAYAVALAGFFLHGFVHLAQAAAFRGYTPGSITAALVVIPVPVLVWRRLAAAGRVRPGTMAVILFAGAALVLPAILLALWFGRQLG